MRRIKILIIGGGFAGVYTLKRLHRFFHNDTRIEITLIGEKNYFLFTPLLHEVATGGINPGNIVEPIHTILGCCLHSFYHGKATNIRFKDRSVDAGEVSFAYDYLVLAPGAQTNFYGIPGAQDYAFTLKSLEDATRLKNHCIAEIEQASYITDRQARKNALRFIVVGGGPTGVELAAELQEFFKETFSHYYPQEIIEDVSILLVQRGKELLPQFGARLRRKSLEVLRKKRIDVLLEHAVSEVGPSHILLGNGDRIETKTVIWVAGIKPFPITFDAPVSLSVDERFLVNEYLQLKNNPEIFAAGDAAAVKQNDSSLFLPALAQVAVKEAYTIAENIKLLINKRPLKPFYYRHSGNLLSLGQWMAAGEVARFTFWGRVTWWVWRTVYLSKLISWRKKIKVAVDWTINLFLPRDISQL